MRGTETRALWGQCTCMHPPRWRGQWPSPPVGRSKTRPRAFLSADATHVATVKGSMRTHVRRAPIYVRTCHGGGRRRMGYVRVYWEDPHGTHLRLGERRLREATVPQPRPRGHQRRVRPRVGLAPRRPHRAERVARAAGAPRGAHAREERAAAPRRCARRTPRRLVPAPDDAPLRGSRRRSRRRCRPAARARGRAEAPEANCKETHGGGAAGRRPWRHHRRRRTGRHNGAPRSQPRASKRRPCVSVPPVCLAGGRRSQCLQPASIMHSVSRGQKIGKKNWLGGRVAFPPLRAARALTRDRCWVLLAGGEHA